jgi:uncharacterized membrane protein
MRTSKLDHDEHEQLVGYEHVASHVRRLRQRAWSNRLAESLLFLPVLLLAGAILTEELLATADRRFAVPSGALDLSPDAAVALLSTIAGATITTAGVVFSLLVVSLQLASGQFSPRVLRTFWRDRFGQLLVGLLLATFAFCVLALTQVDTGAARAPTLTMAGALLLAFASIVAIVAYLNRITRQQYVGRILESIAGETLELVRELPYGSRVGRLVGDPVEPPDPAALGEPLVVRASTDGWIQQISRRAVIGAAPPGSVVRVESRVGAYLVADTPLVTIWPRPDPVAAARFARGVSKAVIVGVSRTMQQDIDFGLRQLNDIALRALSPAVNDPTTAIEVILRISSIMRPLLCADLPTQAVRDQAGRTLLTPWDLDYREYLAHAYAQLRRYAGPHLEVMLALMRNLRMLRAACMATGAREQALAGLDEQVQAALATAEAAGLSEQDVAALRQAATPG